MDIVTPHNGNETKIYFPGLERTIDFEKNINRGDELTNQRILKFFDSGLFNLLQNSFLKTELQYGEISDLVNGHYLKCLDEEVSYLREEEISYIKQLKQEKDYLIQTIQKNISEIDAINNGLNNNQFDIMNIHLMELVKKRNEEELKIYKDKLKQFSNTNPELDLIQEKIQHLELGKIYPIIDLGFMLEHKVEIVELENKNRFDQNLVLKLPKLTPFKYGSPSINIKIKDWDIFCYHRFLNSFDENDINNSHLNNLDNALKQFYSFQNILYFSGNQNSSKSLEKIDYDRILDLILITHLEHLVPPSVTQNIDKAKSYFGDQIYILAESKWDFETINRRLKVEPKPKFDCPIVVGLEYLNGDLKAHYIDSYDGSPYENLIINQNVGNKPGRN